MCKYPEQELGKERRTACYRNLDEKWKGINFHRIALVDICYSKKGIENHMTWREFREHSIRLDHITAKQETCVSYGQTQ